MQYGSRWTWRSCALLLLANACAALDEPAPDGDTTTPREDNPGFTGSGTAGVSSPSTPRDHGQNDPTGPLAGAGAAGQPGLDPPNAPAPEGPSVQPRDAGREAPSVAFPDASVPPMPTTPRGCTVFKLTRDSESCDFALDPPINPSTACTGFVSINGSPLGCNDPDGWMVINAARIRLMGAACVLVLSGKPLVVQAAFPCTDLPI